MTDTAEILAAVRRGQTPPDIARDLRMPVEYVRNIIDGLRAKGLLPEVPEW